MYASSIAARLIGCAVIASFAISSAQAEITGNIESQITLVKGCVINGSPTTDGTTAVPLGTLNFGTHATLFTSATAALDAASGAIAVQCSPGAAASMTIGNGANYDSANIGRRAMAFAAGSTTYYIGYDLFRDAASTTPIDANASIDLGAAGDAATFQIFATATRAGAVLVAGVYKDIITVTITM